MRRRGLDRQQTLSGGHGSRGSGSARRTYGRCREPSGTWGPARRRQRQKAHAARKWLVPLAQCLGELIGVAHQETLGAFAQGQIDERSVLAADGQEVGENAQDGAPRAGVRLLQQGEHFARAGAESLVAALQAFQYLDAAEQAAALLAQVGSALRSFRSRTCRRRSRSCRRSVSVWRALLQPRLQLALGLAQFLQLQVERGEMLGRLLAALQQPHRVRASDYRPAP